MWRKDQRHRGRKQSLELENPRITWSFSAQSQRGGSGAPSDFFSGLQQGQFVLIHKNVSSAPQPSPDAPWARRWWPVPASPPPVIAMSTWELTAKSTKPSNTMWRMKCVGWALKKKKAVLVGNQRALRVWPGSSPGQREKDMQGNDQGCHLKSQINRVLTHHRAPWISYLNSLSML